MPKTKVLFVSVDMGISGAEKVTTTLLRHLDPARVDCTLFLFKKWGPLLSLIPEHTTIEFGVGPECRIRRGILRVARRLFAVAARHDVVVCGHWRAPLYLASLAAYWNRKPFVAWVHTDPERMLPRLGWLHNCFTSLAYSSAARLVTGSSGTFDSLVRLFPRLTPRTLKLSLMIEADTIRSLAQEAIPESLSGIFAKPTLLAMGRLLNAEKGFDLLLEAHRKVLDSGVVHNLLLVGDGPSGAELRRQAKSLGIENSVFMPGFVQNQYSLMRAAHALVSSSREEGFQLVLAEALAVGCPVVATDCPSGPAEILDAGRHGLLVPPESPEHLAHAMESILNDENLRQTFALQGPARAAQYAPDRVIPSWMSLLEEVAHLQ